MPAIRITSLSSPRSIVLSRVPFAGELLTLEDGTHRVVRVTHTPCSLEHSAEVQLGPELATGAGATAHARHDHLGRWADFVREVRARLEHGREAYGDQSFARPPAELLGELSQEALDLAGWGFVLWARVTELPDARSGLEE